ncbi:MAG: sugar transferase [Thermoguttaceae bacterium]|jgi:lipopolysaccharide/colanic/teichoic acid biosynthesis glycosyltransferase
MIAAWGNGFSAKQERTAVNPPVSHTSGSPQAASGVAALEIAAQVVVEELEKATLPLPPLFDRDARRTPKASQPLVSLTDLRLAIGLPIVPAEGNRSRVYRTAKRAFDILGALVLLGLFAPIMATAWLVLMLTGGKPLFRQVRLGYRGLPFVMYKFRSMLPDADRRLREVQNEKDGPIFKNRRDPRITRVGRFLRATSIDELPQLFNVLLGHMSLVGPRPPLAREVAKYEPWQRRRLAVKPGLTCLWQVSGRSEIGFEDWVQMDLWYIQHQNFLVDFMLLVKTPWSVLTRRGAY